MRFPFLLKEMLKVMMRCAQVAVISRGKRLDVSEEAI